MKDQPLASLIEKIQSCDQFTDDERDVLKSLVHHHTESLRTDGLVKNLSSLSLNGLRGDEWKKTLLKAFETLGQGIHADSIRFYEYGLNQKTGDYGLLPQITWFSNGTPAHHNGDDHPSILCRRKYGELFNVLSDQRAFQSHISDIESNALKALFHAGHCQSVLILPVRSEKTLFGMIRVDCCSGEHVWSPNELSILQPIVFQIRNVLERRNFETQLQNTYRQAQIGTWEMDLEADTCVWSDVTKEIFELEKGTEPDFDMATDFFYDEDTEERVMRAVERAQITGEPYDLEVKIKTAKGNVKWIRDTGQAEFQNGKCVRLYGIVQDIHKRKLAEEESEKNKRLLEAITQQTEVAVWVRDHQGKLLFVNNQWKTIFGLENQTIIGQSLEDFFSSKEANVMIQSDQDVVRRNEQVIFEEYINTAMGPRHFMVNKFPLTGISGLENAVGGIGTDITEIKNTEKRLQETKQKLREIIEHSTNLFYTHDANHELTYLSPQSIDFLGYTPEEAKRRWTEFVTDHPDNEKGFDFTQRAIDTGEAQPPFELQLEKGDGEIIWVEVNEAPIVKDGKTVSIAGSLTNITKRKMAQNKIRDSLREKETLLAEIHHRVKNNLAVVASLMQLQAMESQNSDVRSELLESVLRIKSMAGIHEHLYKTEDFSNLDFAHNLETLVGDVIDTMQFSADISLEFECDEVRLSVNQAIPCSLIVNEVITNIIKHGFKGRESGNVTTKLHEKNNTVTLSVEDNGRGLPVDFDPKSTKTLGMQLIITLTEQLFGSFDFESGDEGTVFTLTFENRAEQELQA